MKKYFALILLLQLVACRENDPQILTVGYKVVSIPQPAGGSINVAVWYPATAEEASYSYGAASGGLQVTGQVAANAAVAGGSWPLIVFSHGFSGGGIGSIEICEAIARKGYVVAAPDHADAVLAVRIAGTANGTIADALAHLQDHPFGNGSNYLYRVREIQLVIATMKQKAEFSIDINRIAYGGHSMGAWTVMKAMEEGPRPQAMFLYSMGELNWLFQRQRYFEQPFFEAINFPTAYFYGGQELAQAIAAGRENVYAAFAFTHSPKPSYGLFIPQGNHFTYNTSAVAPASFGKPDQLDGIIERTVNFLDHHIKGMDIPVTERKEDVVKQ